MLVRPGLPDSMNNLSDIDSLIAELQAIRAARGNIFVASSDSDVGVPVPVTVDVRQSSRYPQTLLYLEPAKPGSAVVQATPEVACDLPAEVAPALIRTTRDNATIVSTVCVVDAGDSRCCNRRCPHVRVTKTSATCLCFGAPLRKAFGPTLNTAEDTTSRWFRGFECLGNFGG